jgi:hypothetical protein
LILLLTFGWPADLVNCAVENPLPRIFEAFHP